MANTSGRNTSGNSNRNFRSGGRNNGGNTNRNRSYGGDDRMFTGGGSFNASDYFQSIKQEMEYGIQQMEYNLNALKTAYDALNDAGMTIGDQNDNPGFSGHRGDNQNDQEVGIGGNDNRNYADSNDETDGRTTAGRQAHDADDYSTSDLNNFLRTATRSVVDGSYDLRTKEGRALEAAGWVDDNGFPIKGRGRMFINNEQIAGR